MPRPHSPSMSSADRTYDVHAASPDGVPGRFESTYDTAAEVLAHCEEEDKPYAIKVGGEFLSLDEFMERYVGAG